MKDFKRDSAAAKTCVPANLIQANFALACSNLYCSFSMLKNARRVFELAGMEMPLTIRVNFTEDERREIAETQDWLDSLPEFIRPYAALVPEKVYLSMCFL